MDDKDRGYLGSEEFREELFAQVREQASPKHTGEDIRQSAQAKAEGNAFYDKMVSAL